MGGWRRAALLVAGLACAVPTGTAVAQQDTMPSPRLGPAYGDGRLWLLPLPFTAQELAEGLAGTMPQATIDSAVAAMMQAYLDSAAAGRATWVPPDWTTSIAGQKVGIDPAWIHLGPIRVPTFLLGLLPLNVQANPQLVEQSRRWAQMREMIAVQGARDAALDDIAKIAREQRRRRDAQREFERNQRRPPPTTEEGTP